MKIQVMRAKKFYTKPEIVKKAARLTLDSHQGCMRDMIKEKSPGTVVLAMEGQTLMGWAYLERSHYDNDYNMHIYVRANQRNKGIARKILTSARYFARGEKRAIRGHAWSLLGHKILKAKAS